MAIRGDLLSVDLSNVFQMLAMNRKRGILHLQNRENILEKRALVLNADRIGLLDLPEDRDLAALLVDQGELSYEDFQDAVSKSTQFKVNTVQYLVKRGLITQDQLDGVVTRMHEELILEVFLWKNVAFHLDEENWPEEDPGRRYFVLDLTVMEAARRQDEWSRVIDQIGGGKDIWAQTGPNVQEESKSFAPVERVVFSHIDNIRGSKEITDATGLPRYHVDSALASLSEKGHIRKLELDDLIEVGDQLIEGGRHEDGIRLFKCAVRHDRKSIALHKRLAQAYLREDRVAKSAAHYKFCAIALVQKGLLREALAIYQYLNSILPTDFRSLEQSLSLLARTDDGLTAEDKKTLEQGLKLCNFYFDSTRYDDAQRVLDYLLVVAPDDIGLSYLQAKILAKSGKVNEAIETYMRLAAKLYTAGDLQGALNAYKLVVSFDSATKDICLQRMEEIRGRLAKRQRKKTAGLVFFISVLFLIGFTVGYFYYHNTAKAEFERVKTEDANIVTEEGWQAQSHRYAGIVDRFPLTVAANDAEEAKANAERRLREIRSAVQKQRSEKRRNDTKSLEGAEADFEYANKLLIQGDLRKALLSYERSWEQLAETGQETWGNHTDRRIADRIAELKTRLAQEDDALKKMRELLAEGRREDCFEHVRKNFFGVKQSLVDNDALKVVSRETKEQIRVPLDVFALPRDARIQDELKRDARGVLRATLDAEWSNMFVEVSRPGFRTQSTRLRWGKSDFRSLIVLEKLPFEKHELGDRVDSVCQDEGAIYLLAGNGVVYRTNSLHATPVRHEPDSFVTPSTSIQTFGEGTVFATTEGQILFFHNDKKNGTNWTERLSIDPITQMKVLGKVLVCATHDGSPKLHFLGVDGKPAKKAIELKSPVTQMAVEQGRVFIVDQSGSLHEVDVTQGTLKRSLKGRFATRPVFFGESLFLTDDAGRVKQVSRDFAKSITFDNRFRLNGALTSSAGKLIGVLKEGGVLSIDANLQTKVLSQELGPILKNATGEIWRLDQTRVAIELYGGTQLLMDVERGETLHAMRATTGAKSIPFVHDGRIVLACRDTHGAIEFYRD